MRYDPDKRCATYCGDDRCNCEAGPLNPALRNAEAELAAGLAGLGMDPKEAADYAAAHTPKSTVTQIEDWMDKHGENSVHLRGDGSADFIDWKERALAAELSLTRRSDETLEVVAALYKAWPDAEDISSDWPLGIIGSIEQIISERNEAQAALAIIRQSLIEQAEARADPTMPVLTSAVLEQLRHQAEAGYALAETEGSATDRVFVFGSNLAGRHGKGAALWARQHRGAVYGVGEGYRGNSYAIPTKDEHLRSLSTDERLDDLERVAREATSGPWAALKSAYGARGGTWSVLACGQNIAQVLRRSMTPARQTANARFIAAANPETVLALLSELRTLRASAAELAEIRHRMGEPRT